MLPQWHHETIFLPLITERSEASVYRRRQDWDATHWLVVTRQAMLLSSGKVWEFFQVQWKEMSLWSIFGIWIWRVQANRMPTSRGPETVNEKEIWDTSDYRKRGMNRTARRRRCPVSNPVCFLREDYMAWYLDGRWWGPACRCVSEN